MFRCVDSKLIFVDLTQIFEVQRFYEYFLRNLCEFYQLQAMLVSQYTGFFKNKKTPYVTCGFDVLKEQISETTDDLEKYDIG